MQAFHVYVFFFFPLASYVVSTCKPACSCSCFPFLPLIFFFFFLVLLVYGHLVIWWTVTRTKQTNMGENGVVFLFASSPTRVLCQRERKANGFSISFFPRLLPLFFFFVVVVVVCFFVLFCFVSGCVYGLSFCLYSVSPLTKKHATSACWHISSLLFFFFGGTFLFSFLAYSHLFHVLHARAFHREARKKKKKTERMQWIVKGGTMCRQARSFQHSSIPYNRFLFSPKCTFFSFLLLLFLLLFFFFWKIGKGRKSNEHCFFTTAIYVLPIHSFFFFLFFSFLLLFFFFVCFLCFLFHCCCLQLSANAVFQLQWTLCMRVCLFVCLFCVCVCVFVFNGVLYSWYR